MKIKRRVKLGSISSAVKTKMIASLSRKYAMATKIVQVALTNRNLDVTNACGHLVLTRMADVCKTVTGHREVIWMKNSLIYIYIKFLFLFLNFNLNLMISSYVILIK